MGGNIQPQDKTVNAPSFKIQAEYARKIGQNNKVAYI